ncbi:MAG: U32 family peptidase [Gammaproteobacteria bacterium]|nr:U32 family peptidase [Gammaproteobacteria bacterium]
MELVCPAGNLPALKSAIAHGADAVYLGFRDDTNARHFTGLNFTEEAMREGIAHARRAGKRVFLALNTYPQPSGFERWKQAVDRAVDMGVSALIVADMGVLDYCAQTYPEVPRHLSVQGSATSQEALSFYQQQFGISRAVLPRVLSLKQVKMVAEQTPVELEVFGFGSLCVMVEGRCQLSSYVTGESPNSCGACSPAKSVRWQNVGKNLESRLNGVLIDRFAPLETAGYPTLCKGRFEVGGATYHAFEEPTSLNTLDLLPDLKAAGIKAIKIEGRQRSPAYVTTVAKVWRAAIDRVNQDGEFRAEPAWHQALASVSEGTQTTLGAYHRPWQ